MNHPSLSARVAEFTKRINNRLNTSGSGQMQHDHTMSMPGGHGGQMGHTNMARMGPGPGGHMGHLPGGHLGMMGASVAPPWPGSSQSMNQYDAAPLEMRMGPLTTPEQDFKVIA